MVEIECKSTVKKNIRIDIDFEPVVKPHNFVVFDGLLNFGLSSRVALVVGFLLIRPVLVELMDFDGDHSLLLRIVGLVDLAESALAQQVEQQVAVVVQLDVVFVSRHVLVLDAFHLANVERTLPMELVLFVLQVLLVLLQLL